MVAWTLIFTILAVKPSSNPEPCLTSIIMPLPHSLEMLEVLIRHFAIISGIHLLWWFVFTVCRMRYLLHTILEFSVDQYYIGQGNIPALKTHKWTLEQSKANKVRKWRGSLRRPQILSVDFLSNALLFLGHITPCLTFSWNKHGLSDSFFKFHEIVSLAHFKHFNSKAHKHMLKT